MSMLPLSSPTASALAARDPTALSPHAAQKKNKATTLPPRSDRNRATSSPQPLPSSSFADCTSATPLPLPVATIFLLRWLHQRCPFPSSTAVSPSSADAQPPLICYSNQRCLIANRHAGGASENGEHKEPGKEEDEYVGGPDSGVHKPLRVLVQIRRRHRVHVELRHRRRPEVPLSSSAPDSKPRQRSKDSTAGGFNYTVDGSPCNFGTTVSSPPLTLLKQDLVIRKQTVPLLCNLLARGKMPLVPSGPSQGINDKHS
ncbi:hypothetical protein BHE74_00011327 [Ensete ventricosum]|nr:hypothetical protein BHE74_00011327 [Ensete ventricosum]